MELIEFFKLFSKQPMYFINEYEEAVVRTEPGEVGCNIFVKLKGKQEFKAVRGSSLVVDCLAEAFMITKDEYDNF